ncbi:putative extracellular nuclease surface-anchored [Clostridium sp. CAG:710]|nr:putative extracellular nuclease surface-anchored [Clostridium sp. CAG:710]
MQDNNNTSSNKKTLFFALVCAIVLAVFAYTQVSMNMANNKPKELEEESKEEINGEDLKALDYVREPIKVDGNQTKVITAEKKEKKEVEESNDLKMSAHYTLSFDTNGGEEIDEQVLSNNEVTTTVIPVRESWVFDGWFIDSDLTEPFIFGGVLKEDTTIYAKWVKYVKFVNEDFCIKTITAREDEIITLPTDRDLIGVIEEDFILNWFYVKEDFNKIYITNSTKLSDLDEDSDTATLYLEKIPAFYLSFYLDENSDEFYRKKVINDQVISFDDVDEKLKEINPEIDLTTVGWYYYDIDGNKCDFSKNKTISTDITKIYLSDTYKIIYSEEDDEKEEGLVQIDEQNVARDTKLTDILDPEEKDNKEFEGWFIIDNDILTDSKLEDGMVINRDMTVVGKWKTSSTESNEEMVEK